MFSHGNSDDYCHDCRMGYTCPSCKVYQGEDRDVEQPTPSINRPWTSDDKTLTYRTAPFCACGERTIRKTNKTTKNMFWGCPNFRNCFYKLTFAFSEFGIDPPQKEEVK